MADALPRKPPEKAAEVCRHFELGDEARRLLRDNLTPDGYVRLLLDDGLLDDAIQVVAYWLPKREGVWWGCLCTWEAFRPDLQGPEAEALRAAVRWVRDPKEEHRRAAETAGEAAGAGTPAGGLALAACWSGGSMAPPDLPEVVPPPFLTAQTLVAALALAALQRPDQRAQEQHRFVQLGQDVAQGKHRWE